jgi:hypothetical protein
MGIRHYGTSSYIQNERHILNSGTANVRMISPSIHKSLRMGIQAYSNTIRRLTTAHYTPFYVDVTPNDFKQWDHYTWYREPRYDAVQFDWHNID